MCSVILQTLNVCVKTFRMNRFNVVWRNRREDDYYFHFLNRGLWLTRGFKRFRVSYCMSSEIYSEPINYYKAQRVADMFREVISLCYHSPVNPPTHIYTNVLCVVLFNLFYKSNLHRFGFFIRTRNTY